MYYVINAIIGAVVATAIAYVSRTSFAFLAGILPLFPTFTLFAHIFAFQNGGVAQVKNVAIFGLWALVPFVAYIGSLLLLMPHMKFVYAVVIALMLWGVVAVTISVLWTQGHLSFKPPSTPEF